MRTWILGASVLAIVAACSGAEFSSAGDLGSVVESNDAGGGTEGGGSGEADLTGCTRQTGPNLCTVLLPPNPYSCPGSSPDRRGCVVLDRASPDLFCCN